MASTGSFGVASPTGNQTSRSVKESASVANLINSTGRIVEGTTHGAKITKTEEFFAGTALPADAELTAIDGQNGASLITEHGYDEKNDAYATISKTTEIYNTIA